MSIKSLYRIIDELRCDNHKRKRFEEAEFPYYTCGGTGQQRVKRHCPMRISRIYDTLFQVDDVMYSIIGHLFSSNNLSNPLNFRSDTTSVFRPGHTSMMAMRDLSNFLSCCRYMHYVMGPVIRRNRPIIKKKCLTCYDQHFACKYCQTSYCYNCDVENYPSCICTGCGTKNVLCLCHTNGYTKERKDYIQRRRCYACKKTIKKTSFS